MARSIEESLNIIATRLSTAASPSAGGFIPDARLYREIHKSLNSGWGKRKRRLIRAHEEEEEAERVDSRYQDLIRAQNAMHADPTRWKSTSDYFKWEKGVKAKKAAAADANYNWWYDNAGEKEQFLHDATKKYGSRSRAEQMWQKRERDILIKGLPTFFKNSKMSTKNLQRISKFFGAVRGVPGLGMLTRAGGGNPAGVGFALGASIYAMMRSFLGSMDKANAEAVGWENAWNIYGKPNKRFMKAAMAAGVTDPAKISELWGKLNYEWGDANMGLAAIGRMSMAPGKMKTFLAKGMGIDPALFAIADIMAGNIGVDQVRQKHANVEMGKVTEKWLQLAGQSTFDQLMGWGAEKMGAHMLSGRMGDSLDFSEFNQTIKDARSAAVSADRFDTNGGGATVIPTSKSQSTSWNVNIEHLESSDVPGMVRQLEERAGKSASMNEMIIDDNDSKEVR